MALGAFWRFWCAVALTNVGHGIRIAPIPLLAASSPQDLAAVGGVAAAAQRVVPRLVPPASLERANGRLVAGQVVGNELVGPLVGASLFAVDVGDPGGGTPER